MLEQRIVIRFQFSSPTSIMKPNYNSLVKTININMKTILHPYEMNTTYHEMHYFVVVGLLHLFDPCFHERIPFEYHLNYHESLYVGCCLLFLIFQFKYQKYDKYTLQSNGFVPNTCHASCHASSSSKNQTQVPQPLVTMIST